MNNIFIDMDNVVADFESHYLSITGSTSASEKEPIKRWGKLAGKEKTFFLSMPPFESSVDFLKQIMLLGETISYSPQFLTAIPSLWEFPTFAEEKALWITNQLNSSFPVVIGPYARDKVKHCKPGDILIDDSDLNIQQWREAGGIGILHLNFEKSLVDLRNIVKVLSGKQ